MSTLEDSILANLLLFSVITRHHEVRFRRYWGRLFSTSLPGLLRLTTTLKSDVSPYLLLEARVAVEKKVPFNFDMDGGL